MDLTEIIHFDNAQRHPWELARYQVVKDHIEKITKNASSSSLRILDIGCGDAFLVHQLSLDFPSFHFIGVDINFSNELLDFARKNIRSTNLEIFQSLDEIKLQEGSIDLILLLDVIEHIEDEITFLKSLSKYDFINRECPLLITVPAYQSLFAVHDVVLGHYRRYSNQTLRRRLKEAGYNTSFERYFFLTLLPPRILQLIIEKINQSKSKPASDLAAWKGGNITTEMIKWVLLLDYKLGSAFRRIGIKLPGLSNLVICHRSV